MDDRCEIHGCPEPALNNLHVRAQLTPDVKVTVDLAVCHGHDVLAHAFIAPTRARWCYTPADPIGARPKDPT